MRTSFLWTLVALLGSAVFLTVIPGFGTDYLIIKKRDGTTQKVPLNFPASQIEDFDVQSLPEAEAPRVRQPVTPVPETEKPPSAREAEETEERVEREPPPPTAPQQIISPRGPGRPPSGPTRIEGPAEPRRKPLRGVSLAPVPGGKGAFTVNVYKLPDNVRALPDFSAFHPRQVITADAINLDPAKGDHEPGGLPQEMSGLGLRFVGMFVVSGEGIFKWRILAKDGVRVHIDDKTLIEIDGIHEPLAKSGFIHLAEGVHSIVVDSFNSTGSPVLKLFVQPPIGPEQVFSIGNGLAGWKEPDKPYDVLWGQVYFVPSGKYPKTPDLSRLSPIGRLVAPELNISGGEGFVGLPGRTDMVSIKYQGFFSVTGAGVFAFRLVTDNDANLTIGEDKIVDVTEGSKDGARGKTGWAFLQNGNYPIAVEYFHARGEPRLELYVAQPEKEEEIFAPSKSLAGYSPEEGQVSMIPAFAYFLKPGLNKLPNFNKMSPSGMFFTKAIDYPVDRGTNTFPGVPLRDSWLGLRFYVKFSLSQEEAGTYTFRIVCRDGSRLIIGKKIVVNADGVGKSREESGSVDLTEGSHEMFLDYFHTTGASGLQLFITPPGGQEKIFAFN